MGIPRSERLCRDGRCTLQRAAGSRLQEYRRLAFNCFTKRWRRRTKWTMGIEQGEIRMWSRKSSPYSLFSEFLELTLSFHPFSAQGLLRHEASIREEATRTRTCRQRQSERRRRCWRNLCRPRRRRSNEPRSFIQRSQARRLKRVFTDTRSPYPSTYPYRCPFVLSFFRSRYNTLCR